MAALSDIRTRLALALLLASTSIIACNGDTVDIPDELIGEPYCMIVVGSYGHFADGSIRIIQDPNHATAGCACMDPDESRDADVRAMLNELAYEACERAAKQWDFVWNECSEDYESGYWLDTVWWVGEGSEDAHFRPAELHCVSP